LTVFKKGGDDKAKENKNINAINEELEEEDYSDSSEEESYRAPSLLQKMSSTFLEENEFHKEGYLLKKSSKQFFGISKWQKRYFILNNESLKIFETQEKSTNAKEKKRIFMSRVATVVFHYDENAPKKSKKLKKKKSELDGSRFDIYTPDRVYKLKPDHGGEGESQSWVTILRKASEYYHYY